jgi:predicted amidophosphoribosyltransferase
VEVPRGLHPHRPAGGKIASPPERPSGAAEECPPCPRPPHPWRLFGKDYHPATLLARALGETGGRAVHPLLTKRTLHRPQSALDRATRLRNIRGTFAARGAVPGAVIVVDDVCTTGATLREALTILRRAGARDLAALTLARTP